MLLDLLSAQSYFNAAKELFKKTKDPRGLIYCQLAYGELAMLQGHGRKAEKYFQASLEQAKRYGFSVEKCHATMLISYLTGKKKPLCYNSLGVRLKFAEAPFNIP
jgi:hypothetical protein